MHSFDVFQLKRDDRFHLSLTYMAINMYPIHVQGLANMVDLLADRGAEDDAMCAVCGGGDSNKEAGNEIVFCERCDVAVHQECYGVDTIPAGQP